MNKDKDIKISQILFKHSVLINDYLQKHQDITLDDAVLFVHLTAQYFNEKGVNYTDTPHIFTFDTYLAEASLETNIDEILRSLDRLQRHDIIKTIMEVTIIKIGLTEPLLIEINPDFLIIHDARK